MRKISRNFEINFKNDEKNYFIYILDELINKKNSTNFEVNYEHFKENFNSFDSNNFLETIFKDLEMNFKDQANFKDLAKTYNKIKQNFMCLEKNFNLETNIDNFNMIFNNESKDNSNKNMNDKIFEMLFSER